MQLGHSPEVGLAKFFLNFLQENGLVLSDIPSHAKCVMLCVVSDGVSCVLDVG